MPIQFRCHNCKQVLSITSKKAGVKISCPSCREETRVPTMEEVQAAIAAQQEVKGESKSKGASKPEERRSAGKAQEPAKAAEKSAAKSKGAGEPASSAGKESLREPLPSEGAAGSAPDVDGDELFGEEELVAEERQYHSVDPSAGKELWSAEKRNRDPWLDEEADEDEDFKIGRSGLDEGGLDMTPMVDVTFLLLIFFMITAAFNVQKSMQADPPQPEDEGAAQTMTIEEQEEDSIVVTITEKDELLLDDEPVGGIGQLGDVLKAKAAESSGGLEMTIEADPRCTVGIIVGVMDTGITVGMQRIKRKSMPIDE
ncbi:MAG: biopolymer transporter ExbD [Planctomycetaceae bacterium]